MSNGYMLRGGASGVSLSVKSYTAKSALPLRAPENAIGVISNAPVSKFDFTGVQPGNPIEGEVWVKTTAAVNQFTFNLLLRNELLISPVIVWQYSGGKWASKDAYIFKNGKWINITVYLIENGNYTSYISEFSVSAPSGYRVTTNQTSSYLSINVATAQYGGGIHINTPQINFSGYKKLFVECEPATEGASVTIYRISSGEDLTTVQSQFKMKKEIDLTNFNVVDGIGFRSGVTSHSNFVLRIYNMWLE